MADLGAPMRATAATVQPMTWGEPELQELRDWLREQGASDEQLVAQCRDDVQHLVGVASDLAIERDAKLSAQDVAARAGIEARRVVDIFRKYGVAVPELGEPLFTEADVTLVELVGEAGVAADSPDGRALARVVATALDSVADAAVALYVQGHEHRMLESGASPVAHARKSAAMIELAGRLGNGMGVLFRHHLRQAIQRQRVGQADVTSPDVVRIAIGFVDLVGSTAYGQSAAPSEVRQLVSEFEARTFDVASEYGGRVVKFIGDEIMVAALDPVSGCRLMRALVRACCTGGLQPRGGLSYGEVLFRGGDYYGNEVNLASRLVDTAIPGEVLVDNGVVDPIQRGREATPDLCFEPAGRRLLKGFADPVAVWSVTAAPGFDP
jgi:adenylate cyclase